MEKEINKYKISFSEYSSYLQCPHKWYLNYCLGLPGDVSEELIFGQVLHKSIEDMLGNKFIRDFMLEGVVKANLKEELLRVKDIGFLTKFSNSGLSYVFVKQCVQLLKELNFHKRFADYEIVSIEFKLDDMPLVLIENTQFVLKGFIDIVLINKNNSRILVIDWKSSKKAWDIQKKMKDNEDLFTQLALYKKFYSLKTGIPIDKIDVKFFNLPREEPKKLLMHDGIITEDYIEYLLNKLNNVCAQIYNHNPNELNKARFKTKNNFCHRCHFNKEEMCNDYAEFQIV